MSVPEGKRSHGNMEVFVKTQGLASYTAKILSNAKIFKPEVDAVLIDKIKECAYGIHTKTWTNTTVICGGTQMISKIIRGATADLLRKNNRLQRELNEQKERRQELEDAVIELGELFAEQDDALVELAELMEE